MKKIIAITTVLLLGLIACSEPIQPVWSELSEILSEMLDERQMEKFQARPTAVA